MEATHRRKCFAVNDRECTICSHSRRVVVHHADGDATNDSISNLVPLCDRCHRKVHNHNIDCDEIRELCNRLSESQSEVDKRVDPEKYPGVPSGATITIKETQPGLKYYYWQWREKDSIKSKYIGPVSDFETKPVADQSTRQMPLSSF